MALLEADDLAEHVQVEVLEPALCGSLRRLAGHAVKGLTYAIGEHVSYAALTPLTLHANLAFNG